jgi:hypothetical protein
MYSRLLETILDQYAKGLVHCDQQLGEEIREKLERLKWALWHGSLYKALAKIDDLESLIDNFEETYPKFKQLANAVEEFCTYIVNNSHLIPNYGERFCNGEAIATGFVESTVNQAVSKRFCKRQQMQWSKRGVHLLLQRESRPSTANWALYSSDGTPTWRSRRCLTRHNPQLLHALKAMAAKREILPGVEHRQHRYLKTVRIVSPCPPRSPSR